MGYGIEKAVENADVVLVCLSSTSVSKEGYIQRELKFVLDIALEKPEGTIFIVPLRLDECELPRRLRSWQYVNYFPETHRQNAYQKLLQSLQIRSKDLEIKTVAQDAQVSASPESIKDIGINPVSVIQVGDRESSTSEADGLANVLEVGGIISLIVYLLLTSFDLFASTGDTATYLVSASALAGGVFLLYKRQIPKPSVFKYSMVVYLLGYALNDYFFYDENQLIAIVVAVSALVCSGLLAMTFRSPRKTTNYSALFFAFFLFFYGASSVLSSFTTAPPAILGLVVSVITALLLLMDL